MTASTSGSFIRAQRLSASEGSTRLCDCFHHMRLAVLNAFRHQRDLHHKENRSCGPPSHVLNAFRHQRDLHGGSRPPRLDLANAVLNAFRHQRDLHTDAMRIKDLLRLPVLNAFRHQRDLHTCETLICTNFCCAQRLSASEGSTPG